MATISVKDATGATQTVQTPAAPGQSTMANSKPVAIASDQTAVPVSAAASTFASGALADGAITTVGAKADAKNAATDVTAISAMSVWKQISFSIQAAAASLAGTLTAAVTQSGLWNVGQAGTWTVQPGNTPNTTAWKVDNSAAIQLGAGAATPTTQRVTIDSLQLGTLGQKTMANSVPVAVASDQSSMPAIAGGSQYKTVAAAVTAQVLGATGAIGDYLEGLVCVVSTAATSQVQIADGAGAAITVLPNAVGPGVGTYYVPLGLKATGAGWKVTTAAGVSVVATGTFT